MIKVNTIHNLYQLSKEVGNWEQLPEYTYCGREFHKMVGVKFYDLPKSLFHNPFPLKEGAEKGSTLPSFDEYITHKMKESQPFRAQVRDLWGKNLVCFCAPQPCHCNVIAKHVDVLNVPWNTNGVLAVTGHRPQSLFKGWKDAYSDQAQATLRLFAEVCLESIKPRVVITGMALGWDTAIAEACVNLRIPFVAAVPCDRYEDAWRSIAAKKKFWKLREQALRSEIITPGPYLGPGVLFKRNNWMVEHCDEVLSLYDGSKTGGTFECVNYAKKHDKRVRNVWEAWNRFRNGETR